MSAWLKRYEPAAFCGALLNTQPMGFYAPSQLVQDARRHGVEVRPVDVTVSEWDCTLEKVGSDSTAGGRRTSRLRESQSDASPLRPRVASRPAPRRRTFGSRRASGSSTRGGRAVRERRPISRIARGSTGATSPASPRPTRSQRSPAIATTRRGTSPASSGCRRCSPAATFAEADPALPPPTEGQDIVADYRTLSLTLRRHPLALLRGTLQRRRLATAAEIAQAPHGRIVRTAGIVIGRQRPDTASGVIFVTLEDETGATNVIVWRDVGDRQRRELLGAKLLAVFGKVEREGAGRPRARRTARRSVADARQARDPLPRFSLTASQAVHGRLHPISPCNSAALTRTSLCKIRRSATTTAMAKPEFDIVVIGGGAGGLVVAAGGAALGAKVALVEKHKLGGDCLLVRLRAVENADQVGAHRPRDAPCRPLGARAARRRSRISRRSWSASPG